MAVLALVFGGATLVLVIVAVRSRRAGHSARRAQTADGSYIGDGFVWMSDGSDGGSHDCGSSDAGGCDGGGGGGD